MFHRSLKKIITAFLIALLIISQTACTPQTQPQHGESNDSFGEDWLLNTYCTIQVFGIVEDAPIREAFAYAREYENLLSRTVATSDIGKFNASEQGCTVSDETALLLCDCLYAQELTDGKFDVTVGSLTELWNFSADEPRVPDADAIAEALTHVGNWGESSVEATKCSSKGTGSGYELSKTDPLLKLDLGAAAKGFIADRTAAFLRGKGAERAIVNFGGNIVFIGSKEDGSAWNCGIEDPAEGGSDALIQDRGIVGVVACRPETEDGIVSVVTSGTYERCFEEDGVLYHHVLDPATGYPVETDLLSATVIGEDSAWCDILSTSCLLLGSEKGLALVETQEGYEAVFILSDGSILTSSGADFTAN
ncbi:MAG: FAD:protein FMN transferase [Firmicutes bacterium]|nr:FAD:protein FMN transferase [Bacillota bacterium]